MIQFRHGKERRKPWKVDGYELEFASTLKLRQKRSDDKITCSVLEKKVDCR